MADPPLKISNFSKERKDFYPNFATSVLQDGKVRIQKTAVISTKALASQETKRKADLTLMKRYGMLPGSLKKAVSEKSGHISFAVQVLSVRSRVLQISDGLNTILTCIADCDITNISSATNPIIWITRWSFIQMMKAESVSPPGSVSFDVKPQYGLKLQEYSVLENFLPLPVIGNPKIVKVLIYKNPIPATDPQAAALQEKRLITNTNRVSASVKESEMEVPQVGLDVGSLSWNQVETMIIRKLKFLNIHTQSPAAEAYQFWVRSICQSIRTYNNGYYCAICGKLSRFISAWFVTHIQKHHSEFPGYRCPKSGCILPNLLKFQKHQILKSCQEKTPFVEVPYFDKEDCQSSVREPSQKAKVASVKLISSSIIKSFDSQDTPNESSFDELWRDLASEFKEEQQIPGMGYTYALHVKGSNNLSEIVFSTSDSFQTEVIQKMICPDKTDSQAFNWQEELDRMASSEEVDITAKWKDNSKLANLENRNPMTSMDMKRKDSFVERNKQRDEENENIMTSSEEDEAIPVYDLNTPPNKEQELLTYHADVCQPFNWKAEMDKRIKLKGKIYHCIECGFKTTGHIAMINHLEMFHMRDMLGFKCPKCDSMCDTFLTFNQHMKIAHKKKLSLLKKDLEEEKLIEETSFSLINDSIELLKTAGDELFDWRDEVKKMIVRDGEDLHCTVCRFSSRGKKNILNHIETEHMENLLGFRCPDCDVLCRTFVNFNQHMNIYHKVFMNLLQNGSLFI